MKSVFKILFFVLLLSFLLDKLVYLGLNKVSDRVFSGQNIGKLNHFLTLKDTLELVVFGSSRANHHIDVSQFKKSSFNMGVDGRQLAYVNALVQTLPLHKEQLVLINIDPVNLYYQPYQGDDISALNCKFHRSAQIAGVLKASGTLNPLSYFYWSLDYNNKLLSILHNAIKPKYNHLTYKGYDPLRLSSSQKKIRDKKFEAGETNLCLAQDPLNPIAHQALKELVEFSQANGKKLVMFTSPVKRDACTQDNTKMKTHLASLGVVYWDETDFFKANPDPELWKDNQHLSDSAAVLFTHHLKKQLLEQHYLAEPN